MIVKSFVLYARPDQEASSFIDIDNPENKNQARLFYSLPTGGPETLILNGVTGITTEGFTLTIPGSLTPLSNNELRLRVELAGIDNDFDTVATGTLKVIAATPTPGGSGSGDVSVLNFPANYPLPDSQFNSLIFELQNSSGGSGSTSVSNFPAEYPLPLAQLNSIVNSIVANSTVSVSNSDFPLPVAQLNSIIDAINANASVAINNFPADFALPMAQLNALITAIEQAVAYTVSISNFPTDFPLPTSQASDITSRLDLIKSAIDNSHGSSVSLPTYTVDANLSGVKYYAQIRTTGDTITPAAGKRLKLVKFQIIQNPDNTNATPVSLSFASTGIFFNGWVVSDSSEVIGEVDEPLSISLSGEQVSVLIRYKEI